MSTPKKKAKIQKKAPAKAHAKAAPVKSKIAAKMLVAEGKKAPVKKAPAPRKQVYKFDVEEAILPHPSSFAMSVSERVPAVLKDVQPNLKPRMTVGGRVFLTKDDSIEMMRSLIDVQIQSYRWFLTDGLAELLREVSPITDFSSKKLSLIHI